MTFKCGQTRSENTTGHPFFKEKNHNTLLQTDVYFAKKSIRKTGKSPHSRGLF